MKKDKYPLAGGLIPGDPSRGSSSQAAAAGTAAAAARDMYGSMNGYMPNGYHAYDPSSMYTPYGNSSIYGRYDSMYGGGGGSSGGGASASSAAMSSYMNGAYAASMSMYGSSSPYGSSSMQSMSPVGGGGGHLSSSTQHSPGSVKSDNGGQTPNSGGTTSVPMPSESPGYVKREVTPPAGSGSGGGPPPQQPPPPPPVAHGTSGQPPQQDLNRMISMYLPGDAAAAAAGDPNAQSRLQSMYAGHYQAMVGGGAMPPGAGAPPSEHLGHAAAAMSMAHM